MLAADVIRTRELTMTLVSERVSGSSVIIKIATREPDTALTDWAQNYLAFDNDKTNEVDRFYALEAENRRATGVEEVDAYLQIVVIGELALFTSPAETYTKFAIMLKESKL